MHNQMWAETEMLFYIVLFSINNEVTCKHFLVIIQWYNTNDSDRIKRLSYKFNEMCMSSVVYGKLRLYFQNYVLHVNIYLSGT